MGNRRKQPAGRNASKVREHSRLHHRRADARRRWQSKLKRNPSSYMPRSRGMKGENPRCGYLDDLMESVPMRSWSGNRVFIIPARVNNLQFIF